MKIKLLLSLLLVLSFTALAQENVKLMPNKEMETLITLQPVANAGVGAELNLPALLYWDKANKLIKVQFRGDKIVAGRYLYFFPKTLSFNKVAKEKKDVWFDKGMNKTNKKVEKGIGTLFNLTLERENPKIETLVTGDADSKWLFTFRELDSKEGNFCLIPMTLYVASRQPKTAKSVKIRKIEYKAQFTINITLVEICKIPAVENKIKELNKEIEDLKKQKEKALKQYEELADMPCKKVGGLKKLPPVKEEKYEIKDRQYIDCYNLIEAINAYNETLLARNHAVNSYNALLDERKQDCQKYGMLQDESNNVDCNVLEQVNDKLMSLYLKISNDKQKNLPAYRQEFEKAKKTVEESSYHRCAGYAAYKKQCTEIDKLLKK